MTMVLFLGIFSVSSWGWAAGGDVDLEAVLSALENDSARIRCHAAYELGEKGNNSAVECLLGCLADPDAHVRRIAAKALGKLEAQEAVVPLVELLHRNDQPRHVQRVAVWTLGRIGDSRAAEVLVRISEQETGTLKREALASLSMINGQDRVAGMNLDAGYK